MAGRFPLVIGIGLWILGTLGAESSVPALTFQWWGSVVRKQVTVEALLEYQRMHPEVRISGIPSPPDQYETRMMVKIAGNLAPDLMQVDPNWLPDFDDIGLDSLVDFHRVPFDLSSFDPRILDRYCSVNGRLVGLPMGVNSYGLMVNKTVLKRFHIPVDTHWTWTKIRDEGRRLHQQDPSSYLLYFDAQALSVDYFNEFLRSRLGGPWLKDDGRLGAPQADLEEAFRVLKSLYDAGAVAPLGQAMMFELKLEQSPLWTEGKVAMVQDWSGTLDKYKLALPPGAFGVARNIQVEDGADQRSVPTKPSMLLTVKRSADQAQALKFAQWFLTSPEAAVTLGVVRSVPASSSALKALENRGLVDPDLTTMMAWASANPAPYNLMVNSSQVRDLVIGLCKDVIFGQRTPEGAASELAGRIAGTLGNRRASG